MYQVVEVAETVQTVEAAVMGGSADAARMTEADGLCDAADAFEMAERAEFDEIADLVGKGIARVSAQGEEVAEAGEREVAPERVCESDAELL